MTVQRRLRVNNPHTQNHVSGVVRQVIIPVTGQSVQQLTRNAAVVDARVISVICRFRKTENTSIIPHLNLKQNRIVSQTSHQNNQMVVTKDLLFKLTH